jgi:hypothetical protein
MKTKIFLVIIIFFFGCTPKEITTVIKPVAIAPPVIEDSLKASVITDTVIIANTIYKKDTLITVKYYPKEKKFYIKAKPDTIIIMDTVKSEIVKERVKDRYDSRAMYAYLFGAIMFIIMIYKLFK